MINKLQRALKKEGFYDIEKISSDYPEIKLYPYVANKNAWITIMFMENSHQFICNLYSPHFERTIYFKKLSSVIDYINCN